MTRAQKLGHEIVKRSKAVKQKETRIGRPPTGITPMVGVRVSDELRGRIERWAVLQDGSPRLSEAVRRLVELGLGRSKSTTKRSRKSTAQAVTMAGRAIDRAADLWATPAERAKRKRRLIKGPTEFRGMRKD